MRILHPLLLKATRNIVQHLPRTVHPNHLTLTTLLLSAVMYTLVAYYDWPLTTSSWELMHGRPPVPNGVWIACGLALLISIVLGIAVLRVCTAHIHGDADTADGQHARTTGRCTLKGAALDHAVDCWRLCVPLLTTIFALFGSSQFG